MMEILMNQREEQRQQLSQKMIQSAEILQMDGQELEHYIMEQAAENPMYDLDQLEKHAAREAENVAEGTDREREVLRRKLEWLGRSDEQNRVYYTEEAEEDGKREAWNVSEEENSLSDYLMSQLTLSLKTPKERSCMEFLVESLDGRGYLSETPESVGAALGISEAEAARCISLLQSAEPAGVGAANLGECLALQVQRLLEAGLLPEEDAALLAEMAKLHLDALSKQHFDRVAAKLSVGRDEVLRLYGILRGLNPIPGNAFGSRKDMRYIRPDVTVVKFDGYFEVLSDTAYLPRVSVNAYYRKVLETEPTEEVRQYLGEKLRQLEWVRHCIAERSDTLQRVAREIVARQQAFFERPDGQRTALGLREVAEALGVHESTVSRAVKNKFLQCQRGVYPLNYFFVRGAADAEDGQRVTPEVLKQRLVALIRAEDKKKPLSDQKLSERMCEEGYPLSRRTVAKYRAELLIPDASARRER